MYFKKQHLLLKHKYSFNPMKRNDYFDKLIEFAEIGHLSNIYIHLSNIYSSSDSGRSRKRDRNVICLFFLLISQFFSFIFCSCLFVCLFTCLFVLCFKLLKCMVCLIIILIWHLFYVFFLFFSFVVVVFVYLLACLFVCLLQIAWFVWQVQYIDGNDQPTVKAHFDKQGSAQTVEFGAYTEICLILFVCFCPFFLVCLLVCLSL